MQVLTIVTGYLQENCYCIIKDNKALIIDPGDEASKIIKALEPYEVVGVLITHHHFDHVGALKEIENHYHIKEGNKIPYFTFEIIDTKGHTDDSKSYYFKELNAIFVGDFIFEGTIGRTDLGGNDVDMLNSIEMFIQKFSPEIIIYPGHGNKTTLAKELANLNQIIEYYK